MKLKTVVCVTLAFACAFAVSAQTRRAARGAAAGRSAREIAQDKMDAKVKINKMPNIGPQSLISAPNLQAKTVRGEALTLEQFVELSNLLAK